MHLSSDHKSRVTIRAVSYAVIAALLMPATGRVFAQDFTIVLIPDSQYEVEYNPAMFTSQMNWIINHRSSNNITFVTHAGDVVNACDAGQYVTADAAFDLLDNAGVRYSVAPGNHDLCYLWRNYFGASRFSGKSWYGGSYDDNNMYSLFSASGNDFILINLQFRPGTDIINWADNLLTRYSNRRAIIEQHDLLNVDNSWLNRASYDALRHHSNLFLMVCGHMNTGSDGAAYVAGTGTDGHTIHVVLADYQGMSYGNGYLRLFRFSPANDVIYMTTYSPYINASITSWPDRMNLAYNMSNTSTPPPPPPPSISTSGTLRTFRSEDTGMPSAEQSYTVSGTNLSGAITVTAPDGFEISTSSGSGFRSSLSLYPPSGSHSVAPTTIYVRYNPSRTGTVRGNITHASPGASTRYMSVEGMIIYYTVSVDAGSNGRVELSPPGGSYTSGTLVTLTACGNNRYSFDSWSGDLSGNANPAVMNINANKWVRARFVESPFTTVSMEASADTWMNEDRDTYNYGGSGTVSVSPYRDRRQGSLLKWDLTGLGIPSDAIVASASLTFYVTDASACDFGLHSMRRPWTEGYGNGSPGSGASWTYYDGGTGRWGTGGAQDAGSDRYGADLRDAGPGVFSASGSVTIPLNAEGIAVVQGWITNPAGNHGLTIQNYAGQAGEVNDPWVVASKEHYSYFGPRLNISWCVVTAGTIGDDRTICNNTVPSALTSKEDGTGSGTLYYSWESNSDPDKQSWSEIPGQTGAAYAPEALTETTRYRRTTVSVINNVAYRSPPTEPVQITVQAPVEAGAAGIDQTICYKAIPQALTSITDGTGSGMISYRWELNTDPFTQVWSAISGQTGATYAPEALTETAQYRRITVSTADHVTCESSPAKAVEITVQALPSAGSIGYDQTICENTDPSALTSIIDGAGSGAISYRWELNTKPGEQEWLVIPEQAGTVIAPHSLEGTVRYRRTAISTVNGVACESSPSDTVMITVIETGGWSGKAFGDWEVADNWCGGVPGSNADIYIPPGATVHVTSPAASPVICRDLAVAGNLIIDAGAALTVNGDLRLAGDGALYLNHDTSSMPDTHACRTASLITGSPVEAGIMLCLAGENKDSGGWYFFSPPVDGPDVSIFTGNGCDPEQFVERLVTDAVLPGQPCPERGWVSWDNRWYFDGHDAGIPGFGFNSLVPGKGYNLRHDKPGTYYFSGTLNTSFTLPELSCNGGHGYWSGYNLAGNPFPCGSDIQKMFDDPGWPSTLFKAVWYIRDGVLHVRGNGVSVPADSYQGHIPPMQGFFVKTTAAGPVDLPWAKEHFNPAGYDPENPSIPHIRLSVSGNGRPEETVILFDERAKPAMDTEFDVPRFLCTRDGLSIFTSMHGLDYTINGLPFPERSLDIPVTLNLPADGTHKITVMQMQGLDGYRLTLTDRKTIVHIDLGSAKEYAFTAPAGPLKDRFVITMKPASKSMEDLPWAGKPFNIWHRPGSVIVEPLNDAWCGRRGYVKVTDLTGKRVRVLQNEEFTKNSLIYLPEPVAAGIYFIEIRSGIMKYTTRIMIR